MDRIVDRVETHLQDVAVDSSMQFNSRILSDLDATLCSNLTPDKAISLVTRIAELLPTVQQDPKPITELLERVAENAPISFTQIIEIQPSLLLLEGLKTEVASLNLATLAILQTAKTEPEVGIVAGRPELVEALVNLWLRSQDIGVSSKAWRVIALFLGAEVDSASVSHMRCTKDIDTETNLMWRRLTTDRNVYGLLFSLTSLKTLGQPGQLNRRAKGISQFRLMDLIVTFSQITDIWRSNIPEVEQQYDVESPEGLVNYALLHMVDSKDDVLERLQLLQYYTEFIIRSSPDQALPGGLFKNLEFLITKGVHAKVLQGFISPDRNDPLAGLLESSIAAYLQAYVGHYPRHFLEDSTQTKQSILDRISTVLGSTRSNHWAQNGEPTGLLGLLSSLPRTSILPSTTQDSPTLSLPIDPPNQHILSCLAKIFHGPVLPGTTLSAEDQIEAASARALFFLYLGKNPSLFDQIVSNASLLSIPGTAQAALEMLLALTTSKWSTKEALSHAAAPSILPDEEALRRSCSYYGGLPLPKDGLSALLLPPAISQVIPFLLSSSQHLTGTSFPLAQKKWDLLVVSEKGVRVMVARAEGQDQTQTLYPLLTALEARLRNGVLGKGVGVTAEGREEDVVHSVATLSR